MVVKLFGKDIRKIGSGSIGTTNVIRAVGLWPGLLVLVLDIAKGGLPVYWAMAHGLDPDWVIFIGICAVLGHSFSPFMGFKGGKGAATGIGVIFVLAPDVFYITAAVVLSLVLITRYQSIGTLVGVWIPPLLFWVWGLPLSYIVWTGLAAIFIWWKHIPNIQRLLKGSENRIGKISSQKKSRKK